MKQYFRVVGWGDFQHYGDREPIWIKLYTALLDEEDFEALTDAQRFHLVGIFLLAARKHNRIPFCKNYVARKLAATDPVDLDAFLTREGKSKGWIELCDASGVLAERYSRGEEKRQEETRGEKKGVPHVHQKSGKDAEQESGADPMENKNRQRCSAAQLEILATAALERDWPLEEALEYIGVTGRLYHDEWAAVLHAIKCLDGVPRPSQERIASKDAEPKRLGAVLGEMKGADSE